MNESSDGSITRPRRPFLSCPICDGMIALFCSSQDVREDGCGCTNAEVDANGLAEKAGSRCDGAMMMFVLSVRRRTR